MHRNAPTVSLYGGLTGERITLGHRRIGFGIVPQGWNPPAFDVPRFLRSLSRYGTEEDKRMVRESDHAV